MFEFGLFCSRESVNFHIMSAQMVGVFFGAATFGHLSDTKGRKFVLASHLPSSFPSHLDLETILICYTAMLCLGGACVLARDWLSFLIFRLGRAGQAGKGGGGRETTEGRWWG